MTPTSPGVVQAVAERLLPDLDASPELSSLLRKKVANGELEMKSGRGMYDWPSEKKDAWLPQKHPDTTARRAPAAVG